MAKANTPITMNRYFIYARKSSEDKKRQVRSLEDQIKELSSLALERDFQVVDIIQESKTAKKPGREGFNNLLERIHKGEADGVLCWKLDRLSRNPIDGGQISWMLQNSIIKRIQTISNQYLPSDNILMMQVELGMANQQIKDLKTNVLRGTRQKAERGWFPSPILPVGYRHNPLYKSGESNEEIIPDSNFEVMERLWKLLLTGAYTIADIEREARSMGLRNKKGKPYAKSVLYNTFTKPFYAGVFKWRDDNGERQDYDGKHKPMVSMGEFERGQEILTGRTNYNRMRNRSFPYRNIVHCGECTGKIRAEYIHQVICTKCKLKYSVKTDPCCRYCGLDYKDMDSPSEIIKYYYRCAKKNKKNCTQKSIEQKVIKKEVFETLEKMEFDSGFIDWAIESIKKRKEDSEDVSLLKQMDKQRRLLEKQMGNYIEMRANGEISSHEFMTYSKETKDKLELLKSSIRIEKSKSQDIQSIALQRLELLQTSFDQFVKFSDKGKNTFLKQLGCNLKLLDKSLYFITPSWLSYAKNREQVFLLKLGGVQPKKSVVYKEDFGDFVPLIPRLLAE